MIAVFRCDASLEIGSGHLMRCLTLAEGIRERGGEASFICRELPGNLIALLENKGFSVLRLKEPARGFPSEPGEQPHARWLAVPLLDDAAECAPLVARLRPDWLIVDHYAIDRRWEEFLRPHVGRIMLIDDLADRPHDCDLLLDQNLYPDMESRYQPLLPPRCRTLLGPRYALLRPEFAAARAFLRPRDGEVKRVLLFFGGVDLANETQKALHALLQLPGRAVEVDVVVGANNPNREAIRELCLGVQRVHYHCQVDNMAQLLSRADLAIGACGAATLERCCLGVPTLALAVALNQEPLCDYLAELGLIVKGAADHPYGGLASLMADRDRLRELSERSLSLTDGRGVERVIGYLLGPDQFHERGEGDD
jgi:UDP-2,4-diacetamido-2,4,6-trideoxy-beta-L-altropyranose hydrolase